MRRPGTDHRRLFVRRRHAATGHRRERLVSYAERRTDRPASTAKLAVISPTNGQVVTGTTVRMKVSLKDATIVPATTTDIVPDEGHLHVILDDQLISMTGDTTQLLANLTPGQHLLKVEFVASDHAPFDPRVIAAVAFEVQA